ncbi:DUF2332 domain-containing protein [Streptomyces sp. NPDC004658]|uniref:DUF2332 domain-containing protein n=1 Tax=Streptomyces sp. NPDC004658 TaxID=3154672 RepID=UPI0033B4184D
MPDDTVTEMRTFAAGMAPYAPMSSDVLYRLASEVEEGGPVAELLSEHPAAGSPLFYLRALAGVRRLVLAGKAPALAQHLRVMGGNYHDPQYAEPTWALFLTALTEHPQEIADALDRPIQQHHPRRAHALLSGLGMLGAGDVRVLELGACAGLTLLFDRYRWFGPGWEWGDEGSPVRLATSGRHPGRVRVIDRAGCDLAPLDPTNPDDVLTLRSFLPHEDDVEQMELDDAIALARHQRARIDRADAVEWLARELAAPVPRTVRTVVWHSLFWGYLPLPQQKAIEQIMSEAAIRMRLVRISLEPYEWMMPPRLQVIEYS